ncbi:unnamed protein product [Rotaria socialis]|uniref:Uncharacterized protein n=1 Tax=Rotaria socialis TaxID=392032 RepID=A0A821KPT2_9BILA|nr:unnamed protein product [Rotaria socialis]
MCLADADYIKLTGFTRAQHAHILSHISTTSLRNSATRSARSALAYLLMELKLGLSGSVLASMVGVDSKRQMSRIICEARVSVTKHFVPRYLGLAHLTQQDAIDKHTSPIANRLLTEGRDPSALNNCFHLPMVVASPKDDDIIRRVNQLLSKSNILQEWLIQDNLQRHDVWQFIDIDNLFEPFPVLSLDDIRSITLGVYRLKRARSYAEEHSACTELTDPDFDLHINHAPIIHTFNLTQHKLSHGTVRAYKVREQSDVAHIFQQLFAF